MKTTDHNSFFQSLQYQQMLELIKFLYQEYESDVAPAFMEGAPLVDIDHYVRLKSCKPNVYACLDTTYVENGSRRFFKAVKVYENEYEMNFFMYLREKENADSPHKEILFN